MITRHSRLLICLALGVVDVVTLSSAQAQQYDVTVEFGDTPKAHVDAHVIASDERLFTHPHAGGYQWSDYIRNLRAFGGNERPLPVVATGAGSWQVKGGGQNPIHITYDVDLGFTVPMREGAQRGGQAFSDSLYIVNRALFVMSDGPGTREITFHVPIGARVASPWKRLAGLTFQAASNADLVDNTTVLGRFAELRIDEGRFHLDFVLPGGTLADQRLVEPVLHAVMHEYLRMFPDTPEFHIVMTYFQGVEVNGEGYKDSATLTFPEPIRFDNRELWANYLAHELFHHWNAGLITGADTGLDAGSTEWFEEGATEYVANRTLARTGIIDKARWLRRMETNVGLYEFWTWAAPFAGTSLRDAGARTVLDKPNGVEAKTYNRAGVYNGGWVATFCIDRKIAAATGGARDIDDLFRLLFDRYALQHQAWTNSDLLQAASEVAGRDLVSALRPYIEKAEAIPIGECWADAGLAGYNLNYSGETDVWPAPTADPTTRRALQRLWSPRHPDQDGRGFQARPSGD